MKFFGVTIDCGQERGICFGCPCCGKKGEIHKRIHTQICCMKCDIKETCESRCPFVDVNGNYIKGKDYSKKE